jgi:Flp pilus assembly pilin Flp
LDLETRPNAGKKERWEGFLDSVLLSYSQIFFCRDRRVGVILMAATAVHPPLFLGGLIAVVILVGVGLFGVAVNDWFTDMATEVGTWAP